MPLYPDMKPEDFLAIFRRRKWWIIFSILFIFFGASVYCVLTPEMFRSSTTILTISPRVPERLVQPVISTKIEERLATIQQQILSRTRLIAVIDELGLFKEERKKRSREEIVDEMRTRITLEVRAHEAFTLSFVHENPQIAMLTTSRLASFFIDENLKNREQQVAGTAEFIDSQLQEVKKKLEGQEERVRLYKTHFMGELPQQLQANLQIFSRLQEQMKSNSNSMRSAQERKATLESQLSGTEAQVASILTQNRLAREKAGLVGDDETADDAIGIQDDPAASLVAEWGAKKAQLSALSLKYTEQYPELRRLKIEIADLEKRIEEVRLAASSTNGKTLPTNVKKTGISPGRAPYEVAAKEKEEIRRLKMSLVSVDKEIASLKSEQEDLRKSLAVMESRIEKTPRREQEMISLTRDYENTRKAYEDLLKKKLDVDVSQNLEKRQKGEQFQLLDPANLPLKHYTPNRPKIFGIAWLAALLVGFGGPIVLEMLDPTLRGTKEFKHYSGLVVLSAIPFIQDKEYDRKMKIRRTTIFGGLITFTMAVTVFLVVYGDKVRIILKGGR